MVSGSEASDSCASEGIQALKRSVDLNDPEQPSSPSKRAVPETFRQMQPTKMSPRPLENPPLTMKRLEGDPGADKAKSDILDYLSAMGKAPPPHREEFPFANISSDNEVHARWNCSSLFLINSVHFFEERWLPGLENEIDSFIGHVLPEEICWELVEPDLLPWIASWSPAAELWAKHCTKYKFTRSFFGAWMWHILYDHLFSRQCTDKWRGELWSSYGRMLSDMQGRVTLDANELTWSFHHWRINSARMLYAFHPSHSDPERLRSIIHRHFDPFIKAADRDMADDLIGFIVQSAIHIDLWITCNPQEVRVGMRDPETGEAAGFMYTGSSLGTDEVCTDLELCNPEYALHDHLDVRVDFISAPLVRVFGKTRSGPQEMGSFPLKEFLIRVIHDNFDSVKVIRRLQIVADPDVRKSGADEGGSSNGDNDGHIEGGSGQKDAKVADVALDEDQNEFVNQEATQPKKAKKEENQPVKDCLQGSQQGAGTRLEQGKPREAQCQGQLNMAEPEELKLVEPDVSQAQSEGVQAEEVHAEDIQVVEEVEGRVRNKAKVKARAKAGKK